MPVRSLWQSFRQALHSRAPRSSGACRQHNLHFAGMPYAPAQVLEARCLLSSVLIDTTPVTTIQGTEGQPTANVVLMTFTDDDVQAQAGDFSISSLDWGGTIVGAVPSAQVVADPNFGGEGSGWMVVVDTVAFGDIGTYQTSLTVHVEDGADVSSTNTSIAVTDAALTDTTPTMGVGQALGTASTNVTLMTFNDANPYAVAGDFSVAQLDWGGALSGSSPTVAIVNDSSYTGAGSGWKVVADSVTYADAGRHTVAISVHDQDGGDVSSSTFTVRSAALSDTSPGTTFGAVQGEASTNVVLMTFISTDPQAQSTDFSIASLDWGGTLVGTTPSMTVVADASYSGTGSGWTIVADTVTYADVGEHTVSLTVKDQDAISTGSAVTKFSIANAALEDTTPVMTSNASTGVASNTIVMDFTDANQYATASQYSVTNVTWGGTLTGTAPTTRIVADVNYTGTGSGWMVIADSLAYADAGQYLVSVTIQDEAGAAITTSNVTVDVTLLVLNSQVTRLASTTAATPVATDYVVNESTKLWEMTAASAALTASTVSVPVNWTGSANAVSYTVYVSEDGGTFSPFVTDTTATSATFAGAVIGHSYAFYSIAKDSQGNVEQSTGDADTSTNVDSLSAYAREAGLEGFYFVNGAWAEVLRSGSTVTLIDGTGQSSSGAIANETQIAAGNLEGIYDRNEGTITFADGTVWEQARQIAGRWLTDGRAEVGIQQLGTDLTFTNAEGTTSTGQFNNADEIVATDWGLTGRLTSYGTRIRWSDGTVWDLIPELDGASANASGNPNRVEQFGETLVFINRVGQTSTGLFIGQNLVMATDSTLR